MRHAAVSLLVVAIAFGLGYGVSMVVLAAIT